MRILATLLNPSWGEATVCGYSIYTGAKDIRRVIGYMPDFFGVYDDMTRRAGRKPWTWAVENGLELTDLLMNEEGQLIRAAPLCFCEFPTRD